MTRPLRLHAFTWLAAAGCSSSDRIDRAVPAVDAEQPLSAETLRSAFAPPWEVGTTWMVKERCYPGTPLPRRYRSGLLDEWPVYSHYEVVAKTAEAFLLAHTLVDEPNRGVQNPESETRVFLIRRTPFGLADKTPRLAIGSDAFVVKQPWTLGPCVGATGRAAECPALPAVPPAGGEHQAGWPVRQIALQTETGLRFLYWERDRGPSGLDWHTSEPYWEDSFGCSRLVRNLDGSVHRPKDARDLGPAEPRVRLGAGEPSRSRSRGSPADPPEGPGLVSPGWKVGDQWVTKHRCAQPKATFTRGGGWYFPWPSPQRIATTTFAFYEVLDDAGSELVLRETKYAWHDGLGQRSAGGARSPYASSTLLHFFRKRPFALVRWQGDDERLPNQTLLAEHNGGPCINVDVNVDRCPFAMPAEPPDGEQPTAWHATQTVRRLADRLLFEYQAPDGTALTIHWKDGEPWPEAKPSCTALVRSPDGTVLRPDDIGAFLDAWELTPEFEEELAALHGSLPEDSTESAPR